MKKLPALLLNILATLACSNGALINARRCLQTYDDGFLISNDLEIYDDAVSFCLQDEGGKLARPTDEPSWTAFLEYIRKKSDVSSPYWTGVKFSRKNGAITAIDSDRVELTDFERSLIMKDEDALKHISENGVQCAAYSPPSDDSSAWRFELLACQMGVNARARPVCQCISDVKKLPKAERKNPEIGKASATHLPQNGSDASGKKGWGRAAVDGGGPSIVESNDGDDGAPATSSTPLAVIGTLLVASGMVASAYYVSKRRGWDVRRMISRRMPYNRPRVSLRDDTYARGQELIEVTSGNHRPIHVYEEIIPRNGIIVATPSIRRDVILSCSSTTTMPREPPPDPPVGLGRKFSEDAYLKPNLNPGFHRGDSIPNDVRSPPPMIVNTFNFPSSSNTTPVTPDPTRQPTKELKYASVETVHTMLDGEKANNEEYLVSDEENTAADDKGFGRLVVDIPEKCDGEIRRGSVLNSYVPVQGSPTPNLALLENAGSANASPVFPCHSEYENERFLKTVMKAKAPAKPKRRSRAASAVQIEPQPRSGEESVVYSRIPSVSNEPVYSKIKKKEVTAQDGKRESNPGGYAAMRGNTLERQGQNLDQLAIESGAEAGAQHGNATPSPVCRNKELISTPTMQSTTNRALQYATLLCYEIPPEFETIV